MIKKFLLTFQIGCAAVIPVSLGAAIGIPEIIKSTKPAVVEKYKKIYGDTYDYYMKTKYGKPVYLPIKDNTVSVVFNAFDEEAKENGRHAISKLDDVLKTQEFTIYDTGKMPKNNNYIIVSLAEDVAGDATGSHNGSIAQTIMDFDSFTGKMKYPVEIAIEKKYVDCYRYKEGADFSPETSVFSSILQHELGHALGLCDRYDADSRKNTIMYYSDAGAAENYTALDYHNIRYIYDKEYDVTVNYPTTNEVVAYAPKMQFTEEPAKEV